MMFGEQIEQAAREIRGVEVAPGKIDADEAAARRQRRRDRAHAREHEPVDLLADAAFFCDGED